jgi:hypothetical protein
MVGTSMNSGAIPIDGFTGGHDLMVALYGVGQHNFGFTISDFRVFGVGSNNPPTAKKRGHVYGFLILQPGVNARVRTK